ncbi:hypothetical protein DFJ74DRAFT_508068 [Hyaloraphidium curvatum]|nr:hypothetical protein DFJ74DRAFT_508068 [Hyaloraphidium curvatum]
MLSMEEREGSNPSLPRVFFRDEEAGAATGQRTFSGVGQSFADPSLRAPDGSTLDRSGILASQHHPLRPDGSLGGQPGSQTAPSAFSNGSEVGGVHAWTGWKPPASNGSYSAPQPTATKNARKRGWEDDEDMDHGGQGVHASDDAMMEDDLSPPFYAAGSFAQDHGSLVGRQHAPDTGSAYVAPGPSNRNPGPGEGGMLGRFKRVRMDDGPEAPLGQFAAREQPGSVSTSSSDHSAHASHLTAPLYESISAASNYRDTHGSAGEGSEDQSYHSAVPMSPPIPGRFKISLRTPGATPTRPAAGPKTPPASPYAGVNSLLGELHIRHHPHTEGGAGEGGIAEGHALQEDPNSIAMQYAHINTLLRRYEESRRERKGDHGDW